MDDNEGKLFVSYDRNNVTLRLYSSGIFDYYKSCRKEKNNFYNCDFLEMPNGTVTPDGYIYQIRGRISLKEYICGENTISIDLFLSLLKTIIEIHKRADKFKVPIGDCVFDYNCVFITNGAFGLAFLYMPGLSLCSKKSSVYELINLVFLNVNFDEVEREDYNKLKEKIDCLSHISGMSSVCEIISGTVSDLEKIQEVIGGFSSRFRRRLSKKKQNKQFEEPEKQEEKMAKIVVSSVEEDNVIFERTFPKSEGIVLKIGRDKSWADVKMESLFVSRKHAELSIGENGNMVAKDYSLNGTFVNGIKASEGKMVEICEEPAKVSIKGGIDFYIKLEAV